MFQSHLRLIHPIHLLYSFSLRENSTFQSHLRLIHPIHSSIKLYPLSDLLVSIASAPHPPYPHHETIYCALRLPCFNRICASSTLSTRHEFRKGTVSRMFQSHLRLIHPIHLVNRHKVTLYLFVSIASAPHPPYPLVGLSGMAASSTVSIASAPHPPYPPKSLPNGLCDVNVSIASAPHPPYPHLPNSSTSFVSEEFQSHLRLIHPIHIGCLSFSLDAVKSFNRICASSTLSTSGEASRISKERCFNRICASSTLSTSSINTARAS